MKNSICSDAFGKILLFVIKTIFLNNGEKLARSFILYLSIDIVLEPIVIFLYKNSIDFKKS